MCTVVLLRRPGDPWPLILAANRDEMMDRPADPPARHWHDRPEVVAGRDRLAGGTWLALNDHGLVAGVLNRPDSLGPAAGYRSRGELPLEAADHADAAEAAEALAHLDPAAYRPFNMVIADNRDAFWLRGTDTAVESFPIPEGVTMITAHDANDTDSARIRAYLPRFREAEPPDPDAGAWSAWMSLLASPVHDADAGPGGAMTVVTDWGFGTVSSSLIALPAPGREGVAPVWLYAPGRPDRERFAAVKP